MKVMIKLSSFIKYSSIILVTIILITYSCNRTTNYENTISKIESEKKIRVGFIPYYDITSIDPITGELKGFLIEFFYSIISQYGIAKEDIVFIETDWANFALGLELDKYDLSIAGTFKTPPREKVVSFTEPIFWLGNGALVRKDDTIQYKSIDDFNREDISISVVIGEQGYEYAKENLLKPSIKTINGADLAAACFEVESGYTDAALSDQYILGRYAKMHSTVIDVLKENPYEILPICWAVRKSDTAWLTSLNNIIVKQQELVFFQQLKQKYNMIPFADSIIVNK